MERVDGSDWTRGGFPVEVSEGEAGAEVRGDEREERCGVPVAVYKSDGTLGWPERESIRYGNLGGGAGFH